MKEEKYLCRIITGEIIEFNNYEEDDIDDPVFYILHNAKFSHDVTFGGVVWKPESKMRIQKQHVVYIIKKDNQ